MIGDVLERGGAIAIVGLLAYGVLGRPGRARGVALLLAMAGAVVLLAADVWHQPQLQSIIDRPVVAVVGALLALAGIVATTAVALRWPAVVPVAAVAVLPFRVPLTLGGDTANLLVPLYVVIAGGGLARVVRDLRTSSPTPSEASRDD